MTKSQLSRYEIDKELPKLDSLARLLGVLGVDPDGFFAVVQVVDRLTAGEVASKVILRTLLDRQQRVLEEFLGAARVRLREQPTPSLAKGRKSSWLRISPKLEVTAELGDAACRCAEDEGTPLPQREGRGTS